jgi:UPF0716 protein FxsA
MRKPTAMALFILAMPLKGAPMARLLLGLAFLALPIVELVLLIKTGQTIGFWPTLGLVVAAAMLGTAIMSRQGITVARRTREAVAAGRPPVGPVLDGAFLLLAGLLLISPGFITDVFALALLIPPIRNKVARWSVRRFAERTHAQAKMYEARRRAEGGPSGAAPPAEGQVDGPIIEGEFERLGEKGRAPHPGKDRDRI